MLSRSRTLDYGVRCGVFAAGDFVSCWLRTLTAFARHFQQSGESFTKPSWKLTIAHSVERSHQMQFASVCHAVRVTCIMEFFLKRGDTNTLGDDRRELMVS